MCRYCQKQNSEKAEKLSTEAELEVEMVLLAEQFQITIRQKFWGTAEILATGGTRLDSTRLDPTQLVNLK